MRALLLGSALALLACGESVGVAPSAIIGGDADTTTSGVVMLYTVGTTAWAGCSATVVSPHVLVTAAHCVDPQETAAVGGTPKAQVFVGDDFNTEKAGNMYSVQTTAMAPEYSFATLATAGHDLGIVVTNDALPVTPIPYVRAPLDASIAGASVRLVGFGETVFGNFDALGVRESGTTTIQSLDEIELITADALPSACNGDSGGPALVTLNGVETLAAVISHGDMTTDCKAASYADRVDLDAAFVDSFVNQYDPGFLSSADAGPEAGDTETSAVSSGGCSTAPSSSPRALPWLLLPWLVARRRKRVRLGA